MSSRLGVQVFPTETSQVVLRSPHLLHFSPVPEPPVDYTIKEKSKQRPDYSVSLDVFKKEWSPDYDKEEDALRTPVRQRRPRIERRATDVIGNVERREVENILNDLDSSLEKETRRNLQPRSRNLQRRQSLERVKSLAVIGQQAQIAPIMKTEIIEDLRRVAHGQGVSAVNENRKEMVIQKYEQTRRLIDEARQTYTAEYFLPNYDNRPSLPFWMKQLMAAKASKEALRQYEERAWAEFDEWKRRCAPQVQLQPNYRFASRPTLF